MSRETCDGCRKPLGSTTYEGFRGELCHTCHSSLDDEHAAKYERTSGGITGQCSKWLRSYLGVTPPEPAVTDGGDGDE